MQDIKYDIYRYYGRYSETIKEKIYRPNGLKYLYVFRKLKNLKNKIFKIYYKMILHRISKKTFIQIPIQTKIGKGFYIGHDGPIVINPNVVIGNNCNIANGVVIGQENRGIRKGTPTIGNNVWIGANSVIVGKINIGNDILIAPLTYINFDVPDHSIVIGNPGKIIYKNNATEGYINRKVDC